jgi:1-hydroxycarotenoid 3,4-desaturase
VQRVGLSGLGALWRTAPMSTLWSALGDYFHDPRLRQLFGRYATYVGASPLRAPATLMLIAHVEQDGVWIVEGGMRRVADALQQLAERHGARLRLQPACR